MKGVRVADMSWGYSGCECMLFSPRWTIFD